jgi:N-acetylmuramoyl-L-alanine amidase CwlA
MLDLSTVPLLESENQGPQFNRTRVDLIVLHSTEGKEYAGSARSVAAWFQDPRCRASAHYVVDPQEVIQCVPAQAAAWHAWGVNGRGIGVEMCGEAKQSAAQWADADSSLTVRRAADLVAALCKAWDVPVVLVTPDILRLQTGRGITTHALASQAFPGHGDHWDPGPSFPMDFFLRTVKEVLS